MTVVTARKTDTEITIAADSMFSYTNLIATPLEIDAVKLFRHNGLIIGASGDSGEINQMRLFSRNHKPVPATPDGVAVFIDEFRSWLKKKDCEAEFNSSYLIAFDGKCFRTYTRTYDVFEVPEFAAIGTGEHFAVTALHLGKSAVEAVEVACTLNPWCRLPVSFFSMPIASTSG